jgi:hypothetical protein
MAADEKVTDLAPATTPLDGAEITYLVQAGLDTQATVQDIVDTSLSSISGTAPMAYNPITGAISIQQANALSDGYLSSIDWTTFNNKVDPFVIGDLSAISSDGLQVSSGLGAVLGTGTQISQIQSSALNNGFLSSIDWSTFNAKESALTFTQGLTRNINTITNDLSTGIAGGQSAVGGTAASENLRLSSTSNATKGRISIGTGYYEESTNTWFVPLGVAGASRYGFVGSTGGINMTGVATIEMRANASSLNVQGVAGITSISNGGAGGGGSMRCNATGNQFFSNASLIWSNSGGSNYTGTIDLGQSRTVGLTSTMQVHTGVPNTLANFQAAGHLGATSATIVPAAKFHASFDITTPNSSLISSTADGMLVTGNSQVGSRVVSASGAGIPLTESNCPFVSLTAARGSIASPGAVALDDVLGFQPFVGWHGSGRANAVRCVGEVDGAVAVGVIPGRYIIKTADAAGALTEAVRVDSNQDTILAGDLKLNTIGKTVFVKTGTDAKAGTATLVGGTVTVITAAITANSIIMLSARSGGTVLNYGILYESLRTPGVSFDITSTNLLDDCTFDWWLVEKS